MRLRRLSKALTRRTVATPAGALARSKRRGAGSFGIRRVGIGLLVAAVGIGCVFEFHAFCVLLIVIAMGSLWEFDQLALRKGTPVELAIAVPAVLAYILLTATGLIALPKVESFLLGATVIASLVYAAFTSKGHYLARSAYTLLAVLYIGKLISYFITIRDVPYLGIALTIYAIFVIAFTDIFAMLVGVWIGRTPLTRLSPKKTVEGAVGGFVAGTAVGIAFALLPQIGFEWWQGALIGALTSIAAQAGDLVESALKRDARVKDAGSAIGSHGGVLDRFDSYFFGGPAFYLALYFLGFVRHGNLQL